MRGKPLALHGHLKVLANTLGAHLIDNGTAGEFDRGGKRLIEGKVRAHNLHELILPHHRPNHSRWGVTPPFGHLPHDVGQVGAGS